MKIILMDKTSIVS